jgi:hypothetical protein
MKPFNDNLLIYDYDAHRYILNHEGSGEHINIAKAYGSIENIKSNLRSISRTIYNYIYLHSHSQNRDFLEFMLATESNLRKVLYEAMLSQLIADVEAGVDSVKNQAGINFENGQTMDRIGMFGSMISIEAQAILTNGDGKTNLLYPGDRGFRLADDKYIKWEY